LTVYRPHDKVMSQTVVRDLGQQVESLRRKYPDDPIILMGDWNMPEKEMGFVEEWVPSLKCVKVVGDSKTFHARGGRQAGDIDHVVVDKGHLHVIRSVRVDREWDSSDHWPVLVDMYGVRLKKPAPKPPRWRMGGLDAIRNLGGRAHRAQAQQVRGEIANHNYWDPLLELMGEDEDLDEAEVHERIEKATEQFTEVSYDIAAKFGLASKKGGCTIRRRFFLSRGIRRRLEKRRRLFRLIQQMPDGIEKEIMECEY
jgi:hypothetical protein